MNTPLNLKGTVILEYGMVFVLKNFNYLFFKKLTIDLYSTIANTNEHKSWLVMKCENNHKNRFS